MSNSTHSGIEVERKYIVKKPEISILESQPEYTKSEILQIYLDSEEGITHRIRKRVFQDRTEYTETTKKRIDQISSEENEWEISKEEFDFLARKIKADTSKINKTRHTFTYCGQIFEIDVYPQWKNTAIMETELCDPLKEVAMPCFIVIVGEVSGDKSYSNAGMAKKFPREII